MLGRSFRRREQSYRGRETAEHVNHFETMNLNSLVSNSLSSYHFPEPVLAC